MLAQMTQLVHLAMLLIGYELSRGWVMSTWVERVGNERMWPLHIMVGTDAPQESQNILGLILQNYTVTTMWACALHVMGRYGDSRPWYSGRGPTLANYFPLCCFDWI